MIDINKTYRYRNGEDARILCVDRPNSNYPVLALRESGIITIHDIHGAHAINHELDLIEYTSIIESIYRVENFIRELKDIERKYGLEIDHHGEFVSYLRDNTVSNNHHPVIATLTNDSDIEVEDE
jgi:hypothetical protein